MDTVLHIMTKTTIIIKKTMRKELHTYMIYLSTVLSENLDYVSVFFRLFKDRLLCAEG